MWKNTLTKQQVLLQISWLSQPASLCLRIDFLIWKWCCLPMYIRTCVQFFFRRKMIHTAWLHLKWKDTWMQGISWVRVLLQACTPRNNMSFYKQAVNKKFSHTQASADKWLGLTALVPNFFFVEKWCTPMYLAHRHVDPQGLHTDIIRHRYMRAIICSSKNDTHSMAVPQVHGRLGAGYFMGASCFMQALWETTWFSTNKLSKNKILTYPSICKQMTWTDRTGAQFFFR